MAKSVKRKVIDNGLNDSDLDEVDRFHEDQEKILLNASRGANNTNEDEFELSDEEVLSGEESQGNEEEDDYYGLNDQENEAEDEHEGWGTAKNSYYGADEIEDEEAAKEEEAEAIRLQKKHMSELKIQDFYDEEDVEEWNKSAKAAETTGTTKRALSQQDPSVLSKEERLLILQSSYPEVGPLKSELHELEPKLKTFQKNAGKSRIDQIKFAALSSYISTIYAYFALFVGKIENGRVNLKSHSVMKGILKARELWRVAQLLTEDSAERGSESDKVSDELEIESQDENESEIDDFDDSDELENDMPSTKKAKVMDDTDEFELVRPKVTGKVSHRTEKDSDKQQMDEDEKELRKRTLRFYTSKIDQRDNRRTQVDYGGDDDLPYKEREYERRKRLLEEARLRGLKGKRDEADDFGSDDENSGEKENDDDDYYNHVETSVKEKKAARKQAHLDAVSAAKQGRLAELNEELADGEKRAINYQILKNKGLTPKRSKDNRNPRVKKRKKYNEAKKKLKSVRAVYQAPTSSYGGETTGIKKNTIRSVQFKS